MSESVQMEDVARFVVAMMRAGCTMKELEAWQKAERALGAEQERARLREVYLESDLKLEASFERFVVLDASNRALIQARDENSAMITKLRDRVWWLESELKSADDATRAAMRERDRLEREKQTIQGALTFSQCALHMLDVKTLDEVFEKANDFLEDRERLRERDIQPPIADVKQGEDHAPGERETTGLGDLGELSAAKPSDPTEDPHERRDEQAQVHAPTNTPPVPDRKTFDLDAIERRAREATPGEWTYDRHEHGCGHYVEAKGCAFAHHLKDVDARFFAHSKDDIFYLIARVRELEDAIKEALKHPRYAAETIEKVMP